MNHSCIQWFKDTNLKANHNIFPLMPVLMLAVFNGSKILIWKQITTPSVESFHIQSCIQWFKDTNLKANHNFVLLIILIFIAVFNGSKILIWKQITTTFRSSTSIRSCIQWFKDTNLKANHNLMLRIQKYLYAVFNGSKILIWKQITTMRFTYLCNFMLYSMVQRY